MFSESLTIRLDDEIVISAYCPKLLARRNFETEYIQFLHDLLDLSEA